MTRFLVTIFFATLAVFSIPGPATAQQQEPRALGTFTDWLAYSWIENGNKVCYMLSRPLKSTPQGVNRDDIYIMVTFRPKSKSKEEVSHIPGYPYMDKSTVDVLIGNRKFVLATNNEVAWVPEGGSDEKLINAMRSGSKMVVKGKSQRGTLTVDSYSLQGFTAAYQQIRKSCT
ncbi:MAG: invasion associated locus B family protein [Sneathiella sp.]|nr:invasion associated locus B family protein [Sneathiella sp.]